MKNPVPRRAQTGNSSEPKQRRDAPLHRDAPRHHRHHDVAADGRRPRHRAPALQRRRDPCLACQERRQAHRWAGARVELSTILCRDPGCCEHGAARCARHDPCRSRARRSPRRMWSAIAKARHMSARPPPPCSPAPPRRRFRRRPCARRRSLRRRRRPHFRRPRFAPRRRRRSPFSRRPRFPQSRACAARLRRCRPPSRRRSPHSLVQGCRRRRHSLGSPKR